MRTSCDPADGEFERCAERVWAAKMAIESTNPGTENDFGLSVTEYPFLIKFEDYSNWSVIGAVSFLELADPLRVRVVFSVTLAGGSRRNCPGLGSFNSGC